ncbi:hypothetical protein DL96DRAFT_1603993 [Flagelloscypha sp. PMI_526]|nr:hypothetical protein DL96DRAFT_1603993 [Flagelloscypha sp. PMI_526]
MEFMEGGALTNVIEKTTLGEDHIGCVCLETCKGLSHLHSREFINRDAKSNGMLLDAHGRVGIMYFDLTPC